MFVFGTADDVFAMAVRIEEMVTSSIPRSAES